MEKPRIKIKADSRQIKNANLVEIDSQKFQTWKDLANGTIGWQNAWRDWEQEKKKGFPDSAENLSVNGITLKGQIIAPKSPQLQQEIQKNYPLPFSKNKRSFLKKLPLDNSKYLIAGGIIMILAISFWIGSLEGKSVKLVSGNKFDQKPLDNKNTQILPTGSMQQDIISAKEQTPLVSPKPHNNDSQKEILKPKEKTPTITSKYASADKTDTKNINTAPHNAANESVGAVQAIEKKDNTISTQKENKPIFPVTKKQSVGDFVKIEKNFISLNHNGSDNILQVHNISDVAFNLVVIDLQYFDENWHFRKGETLYLKNLSKGKSINVRIPQDKTSAKVNANISMISSDEKNIYLISE